MALNGLGVSKSNADPEILFDKLKRIGKGSFGEVYKGVLDSAAIPILQRLQDMQHTKERELNNQHESTRCLRNCNT